MTVGDVVTGLTASVGAGSTITYQPAAGVAVLITDAGGETHSGAAPEGVPDVKISLYNGTDRIVLRDESGATHWSAGLKVFIDNTNYLQIQNDSGGTTTLGYCGVIVNE